MPTRRNPRENNYWTADRVRDAEDSLMHAIPSGPLPPKSWWRTNCCKKVNAGYSRKVSYPQNCPSVHIDLCPPLKKAYSGHLSIRTGSLTSGRWLPGLMDTIFASCWCPGAWALRTWGRRATRMHYRTKSSWLRQFNALGYVLLGNLRSWHLCGCFLIISYHLTKHCCRLHNAPCYTALNV